MRFMFPNVLFEPPTVFKAGLPESYKPGEVDERYKDKFGVWVVRTEDNTDLRSLHGLHTPGMSAELAASGTEIQMPVSREWLLQERY